MRCAQEGEWRLNSGTLSMIAGSISEGLSLSILSMAILMGWSKLLPLAVVIGNGQDNRSGPGASSKFFYLIILYTFPIDFFRRKYIILVSLKNIMDKKVPVKN
jgi:hypothetical protein